MNQSTDTLLMLAQLLQTDPPILQREARSRVEQLAAQLERLDEAQTDKAAELIINWIEQFPQEQITFEKALEQKNRQELDEIEEPSPRDRQFIIPNIEIIEDRQTKVDRIIVTPAPSPESSMPLLPYLRQTLRQWISKNQ